MKNILLLLAIVLSCNSLFGQENEWNTYELDSIISIDMPGDVYEMDTIIKGEKIYQLTSSIENSIFMAQRMLFEKNGLDKNLSKLPYDDESLEKTYDELISGITKAIPSKLKSKEKIEKNNFKGYCLLFVDSEEKPTFEYNLYLLDKYLYSFAYSNPASFNEIEKNEFINSIVINSKYEISQFNGTTPGYRLGYVSGKYFIYILGIIGIIIFVIIRKRRKKTTYNKV